jgi:hypothetical protein
MTELLEGALQQLGAKSDFEKFRLEKKCKELLGDGFSKALVDISFGNGQVNLRFSHSIWLNEINFRKTEILMKLQRELPDIGIKSIGLVLARSQKF